MREQHPTRGAFPSFIRNGGVGALLAGVVFLTLGAAPAAASPVGLTAAARLAAPLAGHFAEQQQQEEEEPRQAPPIRDPANGIVLSVLGGSVFSGASSFQAGASVAYFFDAKAAYGFEAEGAVSFGPGGRVVHGFGNFIIQAGARTSKFVPYFTAGVGYLRAELRLSDRTRSALDALGIVPALETESGPLFNFGGGLRFYLREGLAVRGDFRISQVLLDIPNKGFVERLYPMRRFAGMVSWDF